MYTYKDAEKYINDISKKGIKLGLDSEKSLLLSLGNPQNAYKKIHIAGTNGKGSAAAFISQILIEAGYNVGLYNSPYVKNKLEIFKVNGENITKEEYADCMFEVKCADKEGKITAYEAETAAAFLWFKRRGCQIAVIEAGLGGINDATNAMGDKVCAVIASISYDHKKILGNTLREIAEKKAGIINNTLYAVSAEQRKEAEKVLTEKCKAENVNLKFADFSKIENLTFEKTFQKFDYGIYKGLKSALLGTFQAENAAVAVEAAMCLRKNGFEITDENIYSGIENARHEGRFEIIKTNPLLIIDGAHNENAAQRLKETINMFFKDKKIYFIMGVFKDKEYKKIIDITAPLAEFIFAVEPKNSRALEKNRLAEEISKVNKNVCACETDEALRLALKKANPQDAVIAFGSLSFLKDIQKE